jgi:hypothetical protein
MLAPVYALYGRSRWIYCTLVWAFVAEHAITALFAVLTARTVRWYGACVPEYVSNLSAGFGCARPGRARVCAR